MLSGGLHKGTEGKSFGLLDQGDETGCLGDVKFCVEDGNCVDFLICLFAIPLVSDFLSGGARYHTWLFHGSRSCT